MVSNILLFSGAWVPLDCGEDVESSEIQADSSLSKERLITIESNIDRVSFKFCKHGPGGWIVLGSLVL